MSDKVNIKVPILYYMEPEGPEPVGVENFPYIEVAKDDTIPGALFIQEWKETGEYEINGTEKQEIYDVDIKLYFLNDILQKVVTPEQYEEIKNLAGLRKGKNK